MALTDFNVMQSVRCLIAFDRAAVNALWNVEKIGPQEQETLTRIGTLAVAHTLSEPGNKDVDPTALQTAVNKAQRTHIAALNKDQAAWRNHFKGMYQGGQMPSWATLTAA